jgi:tetratricopeptide (TPR) repeat protein
VTAETAAWVRHAKNYRAWAYLRQGRLDRACEVARDLLELAVADEAWVHVAYAHLLLSYAAPSKERSTHALWSHDLFLHFGDASDRALADGNWSNALSDEGRMREALEFGHRALHELDRLGRMQEWALMRGNLANLAFELGHFRDAFDGALQALDVLRRTGQLLYESFYERLVAQAAWALGDHELARLSIKRALDISARQPGMLAVCEVEAALLAGALDDALAACERHADDIADSPGLGASYLGTLSWRRGDQIGAIAAFDESAASNEVDQFTRAKHRFVSAMLRKRLGAAPDVADAARDIAAFGADRVAIVGLDVFDVAEAATG